jgi:hypothetical protein
VTAGPGCVIGREARGARGGSLVLAARRFGLDLRAGFRAAGFFRRAGAARLFFDLVTFFFALRFFAMLDSF